MSDNTNTGDAMNRTDQAPEYYADQTAAGTPEYYADQTQPAQPLEGAEYGAVQQPVPGSAQTVAVPPEYYADQTQPAQPLEGAEYGAVPQPVQPAADTAVPKVSFKKKLPGYIEMLAAICLAGLGIWMFYNTRGTRLLFTDVSFGRICKYYWIALVCAAVFFAVGLYTLKRLRKEVKKNGKLE